MEFVALILWLIIAGAGMLQLPVAITAPGAAVAALAAFGGMAACILWIVLGAPAWTGWAQLGLALLGILGGALGAAELIDDKWVTGSTAEVVGAGALGLQLPFYGAVVFVTALMALQVTEPIV